MLASREMEGMSKDTKLIYLSNSCLEVMICYSLKFVRSVI